MNQRQIDILKKMYEIILSHEKALYPNYPKSALLLEFELIIKEAEIRLDYKSR